MTDLEKSVRNLVSVVEGFTGWGVYVCGVRVNTLFKGSTAYQLAEEIRGPLVEAVVDLVTSFPREGVGPFVSTELLSSAQKRLVEKRQKVARGLREGKTPVEVARENGMPPRTVNSIIETLGLVFVDGRTVYTERKKDLLPSKTKGERNAEMVEMFEKGYSFTQISKRFGISRQRAHQIVRMYTKNRKRGSDGRNADPG